MAMAAINNRILIVVSMHSLVSLKWQKIRCSWCRVKTKSLGKGRAINFGDFVAIVRANGSEICSCFYSAGQRFDITLFTTYWQRGGSVGSWWPPTGPKRIAQNISLFLQHHAAMKCKKNYCAAMESFSSNDENRLHSGVAQLRRRRGKSRKLFCITLRN